MTESVTFYNVPLEANSDLSVARQMVNIAHAVGFKHGYHVTPGDHIWQGRDEDGDATLAFKVDGAWHIIFWDGARWNDRTAYTGWDDDHIRPYIVDLWEPYAVGGSVMGPGQSSPESVQVKLGPLPEVEGIDLSIYSAALENQLKNDADMAQFTGGGVRSSDSGRPRFDMLLVSHLDYEDQVLTRAALRMQEGAEKYGPRNFEQFQDQEALERGYASLLRHVFQYISGDKSEDHAAAVLANIVMLSSVEKRVEDNA